MTMICRKISQNKDQFFYSSDNVPDLGSSRDKQYHVGDAHDYDNTMIYVPKKCEYQLFLLRCQAQCLG